MTTFFARPCDISATGFYFESGEEFEEKSAKARNDYGDPVEEFEIQFVDGETIDAQLCEAVGLMQNSVTRFMETIETWDDEQKRRVIIAVGECGYQFDLESGDPDEFDVDLYEVGSIRELAEQFVDEGLFGDIPEHLANYIDYDAIARDLAADYSEACIDGKRYIYRCW